MKRFFLILLVLAGVLAWSNPSQADHQREVADQFKASNPIISLFGGDDLVAELVTYDSYVLFSVGRVADKRVSVGMFGKVFASEIPVESEIGRLLRSALSG